ncbi:MAG: glycosyltransferase, partial [Verrucomicrobiales bacterium]|nr:glycosyltransferase [Verrucomicrobiales bacterium]
AGASLVIERSSECGKAACLNAGVAAAAHELVVFADARQSFDHKALVHLARAFAAPEIGAVGGALEIEGARRRTVGRALDHYWTTEKMLRRAESEIDSTIGCTGAIYAIRRRLYTPIPEDTILDDVLIPMQIALQGYRVVFQPDAIAFDPQPLGGKREQSRKHRTLAGNFQLLFRYPAWLLPWRNRLVIQLVSHKYSRLSTPLLITLIIASNAALASTSIWASLSLSACLALLAIGAAGLVAPRLNESSRIVFLASSFLFLQIAICRSLFYYLNWACERKTAWR